VETFSGGDLRRERRDRTPLLLLLPLALAAGLVGQTTPTSEGQPRFSADDDLVVLHVTARDRKGAFVTGLGKDDFHVLEDGHPQIIYVFRHEDMPMSAGLIVDNSTSMRSKRGDVTTAFVRSSKPLDEIFIVNFNERVTLGLPPAKCFLPAFRDSRWP
jgi:hypothetical protein